MPAMAGDESDVVGQSNTPKHHYIRSEREKCRGCSLRDCPKRGSDRCGRPWPATLNRVLCRDSSRWPLAIRLGRGTSTAPWEPAPMLSSGYGSSTSRSPAAHRGPCRHRAGGSRRWVGRRPWVYGGHPEGWHLCSCRFDGHLTTCAANVAGHRDRQRSDCNPGARHLRWGCDIRHDRRGHRPRYRSDHFHPGCQGPAAGGHGDRPRTHGMENGSFEQPGGSVL
jgi:hypothetical protein